MQKIWGRAVAAIICVGSLAGCNPASFHEDAAKRLESGNPPDLPEAIKEYKQAVDVDKLKTVSLRMELGNCCLKNNDGKGAVDAARLALDIEPRNPDAHILCGKGQLLRQPPDKNEALNEFNNAFTCDAKAIEAAILAGKVLEDQGDNKAAADKYRNAITSDPNSSEAHQSLALVLSKLGDMATAEAENKEAVRLKALPPRQKS
jgi:tetratricopeptide (TPR) repeat protein